MDAPLISSVLGPGRFRSRLSDQEPLAKLFKQTLEPVSSTVDDVEREKDERRRCRILDALAAFHMDQASLAEKVLKNYKQLYCDRKPRPGFRKTIAKDRLALAVSISRQLNLCGAIRLPSEVADVCGVEKSSDLLHADVILNLNSEEKDMEIHKFVDAKPEDYARLICSHMELPRRLGVVAERFLRCVKAKFFGSNPVHIAGAAYYSLMTKLGENPQQTARVISDHLDCRKNVLLNIAKKFPEYDLEVCGMDDNQYDTDNDRGSMSWSGREPINLMFRDKRLEYRALIGSKR